MIKGLQMARLPWIIQAGPMSSQGFKKVREDATMIEKNQLK